MAWLLSVVAPPAPAVIHDLCDGSANNTAPPDDPGWAHMGSNTGQGVIYLGNGWVLTASHVQQRPVWIGGTLYPDVAGSWVQIQNGTPPPADLALWRIDPYPTQLPILAIRSAPVAPGTEVLMIGKGADRGAAIIWMGNKGYLWLATASSHWGTNQIDSVGFDVTSVFGKTRSLVTGFSPPPAPLGTPPCPPPNPPDPRCAAGSQCPEAQAATGDSGGAFFIKNGSTWELAGVMHATGGDIAGQPPSALYGNTTYAADLTYPIYRSQIIALARPECSDEVDNDGDSQVDFGDDPGCLSTGDDHESPDCDAPDADADGVGDLCDSCLERANPSQLDADFDGCGNLCDGDYDQDGTSSGTDFFTHLGCHGKSVPAAGPPSDPTCQESDMDGDGSVAGSDYLAFTSEIGTTAGPSLDPYRDPLACP